MFDLGFPMISRTLNQVTMYFPHVPTVAAQILDGSNQWLCPRCDRKAGQKGWGTF